MATPMLIWSSEESGTLPVQEDRNYVPINGDNGVLIIENYDVSGSRTCTLGFVGPNKSALSREWADWCDEHDDINTATDTEAHLKSWMGGE